MKTEGKAQGIITADRHYHVDSQTFDVIHYVICIIYRSFVSISVTPTRILKKIRSLLDHYICRISPRSMKESTTSPVNRTYIFQLEITHVIKS